MIIQILIVLMIIAALIAVEAKDPIASVIAVGGLGFAMALCFLLLMAPDLAVMLLIVELLVLTALVAATGRRSAAPAKHDRAAGITAAVIVLFFVTICAIAFMELPRFGHPYTALGRIYSDLSLRQVNTPNVVAAVALNFRGYDSLAAIALLFLAALGAYSLTGRSGRKLP